MLITTEPLAVTSKQHLLELLAQPPFETNRCWEWTRTTHKYGYGQTSHAGKRVSTHRLAFRLAYGEIPAGLVVHHTCYRRRCCNPAHLEARTHLENIFDENSAALCAPHNRRTVCPKCGSTDRKTCRRKDGYTFTRCRPCQQATRQEWDKKNAEYRREYRRRITGYYERRGLTPPPLERRSLTPPPHERRGRPQKLPIGSASMAEMNSAIPRP